MSTEQDKATAEGIVKQCTFRYPESGRAEVDTAQIVTDITQALTIQRKELEAKHERDIGEVVKECILIAGKGNDEINDPVVQWGIKNDEKIQEFVGGMAHQKMNTINALKAFDTKLSQQKE